MSDREQLAARLVEAARDAIYSGPAFGTARRAVGAVLRELAAKPDGYLRYQEDGGITYTKTLRDLADYIEKGAGDEQ